MVCFVYDNVSAQTPRDIEYWMNLLESEEWEEREGAAIKLAQMPPDLQTDEIRKALIDELEREFERIINDQIEYCKDEECERAEGGEEAYYSWLFEVVAKMADKRAFPLFVRIGSPTALIEYGDEGVRVILENYEKTRSCGETAHINSLGDALKPKKNGYVAKGALRAEIKRILLAGLKKNKHPEKNIKWYTGIAATCRTGRNLIIRALEPFAEAGDREVIATLRVLANEDPYVVDMSKAKDYKGPKTRYPVREEALKVLRKFEKKQ